MTGCPVTGITGGGCTSQCQRQHQWHGGPGGCSLSLGCPTSCATWVPLQFFSTIFFKNWGSSCLFYIIILDKMLFWPPNAVTPPTVAQSYATGCMYCWNDVAIYWISLNKCISKLYVLFEWCCHQLNVFELVFLVCLYALLGRCSHLLNGFEYTKVVVPMQKWISAVLNKNEELVSLDSSDGASQSEMLTIVMSISIIALWAIQFVDKCTPQVIVSARSGLTG